MMTGPHRGTMLMLGCSCCSIHAFPSNNQIILFSNTAVVAGSCKRRRRPHRCSIVVVLNSRNYNNIPDGTSSGGRDDDEDISSSSSSSNNNSEIDDSNNNDLLYYELNKIKQDMFGTNIPSNDELTTAAQNSEADFLAAMLEQTQQFQQIKLNEGSERACEVFMERIQAEDEADRDSTGVGKFSDRIESAEQGDAIESDDSGFEEDTMWYEQEIFQVDETTIKISKEIDVTDGNNFWQ